MIEQHRITWRTGVVAAMVLAVAQCVVETVAVAVLHGPFLLAPLRFFPSQTYDAFVKIYVWLETPLGLPRLFDTFIGQGTMAKLVVGAPLLAMALPVAIVSGVVVASVVARFVRAPRYPVATVIAGLALCEVVLHTVVWATSVQLPVEPTWHEILRNYARDFLFDGTVVALATTVVAAAGGMAVARLGMRSQLAAAAAGAAALFGIVWLAPRPATATYEAGARPRGGQAVAKGYNVVLISIDSLRADHLGAYGYDRDTSPTMDALARDGVLFRRASSTTSWTLPAHMSMLTGRSLLGHGVVSDDRRLTSDVPTLAEQFQAAGYATGGIVSAPYVEARYGFDRGFDEYDDQTIRFKTHGESYRAVTAPRLQEAAAKWLERHTERPFFLFLHYWDVHYDYDPGPPYDKMFDPDYTGNATGRNFYFDPKINRNMPKRDLEHIIALYDGEIRLVDDHLAKLRRTLATLGLAGRTVIVVTSDHGDEFFEHGRKGHHRTLYDEVLRVPLILYIPDATPTKREVDMEVSIIDIAPTLLGLTGIASPPGLEGWDLSAIAFGDEPEHPRRTFGELYRKSSLNVQISIRSERDKLIHHFNRRLAEAYDMTTDPAEQKRLPLRKGFVPARMAELKDWLDVEWLVFSSRLRSHGIENVEMDEETRDRLRSLGYLQ